jgi:hypothetical protein
MGGRLGPLVLLIGLLARCGGGAAVSSTPGPPPPPNPGPRPPIRGLVLPAGAHHTFSAGDLRPGAVVTCLALGGGRISVRVPYRPPGTGWSVGKGSASPGGTGGTLELQSRPDGSIAATCDR